MDFILGLIFWGGLLLLTLSWIARTGLTGHRSAGRSPAGRTPPPRPGAPPHPAPRRQVRSTELQQLREDEALADGLVIGHFLTRDHYRDRIDALEDDLDALGGSGVEPWGDDPFDAD